MTLDRYVAIAAQHGASDLHLEADMPVTLRVRGELKSAGEPLSLQTVREMAREAVGEAEWPRFEERQSADLARTIGSVRCRINVMITSRGPGLAVRLLPSTEVSLEGLNLHPDLAKLVEHQHGLILVSGPTGCGKSSTMAAMIQEINRTRACHIVTVEQPVEYDLQPRKAFIRQREVGRDTPSFDRALVDALREDIDVLMVGEMRERETMRLTLDACETGHLVLATLHSSTVVEALQRIISAFPAEEQSSVGAQLGDNLIAVISQRLAWREELGIRVPELEMMLGNSAVRSIVRQGQLFKLVSAIETGGKSGMWTLDRYRRWLDAKEDWSMPEEASAAAPAAEEDAAPRRERPAGGPAEDGADDVIVIQPEDRPLSDLLSDLDDR
jgi:twitching motility protein PilT